PTIARRPEIRRISLRPATKAPLAAGPVTPLVWVARSEPRAATLVAMPTWRKVLLIPEAMPATLGSTTPTAVEASGGLTRPLPRPATRKPGIRWVQSELASRARIRRRPAPKIG